MHDLIVRRIAVTENRCVWSGTDRDWSKLQILEKGEPLSSPKLPPLGRDDLARGRTGRRGRRRGLRIFGEIE
jgi:hypothetical protein